MDKEGIRNCRYIVKVMILVSQTHVATDGICKKEKNICHLPYKSFKTGFDTCDVALSHPGPCSLVVALSSPRTPTSARTALPTPALAPLLEATLTTSLVAHRQTWCGVDLTSTTTRGDDNNSRRDLQISAKTINHLPLLSRRA